MIQEPSFEVPETCFHRIWPVVVVLPMLGCDDDFQGASTAIGKSWSVDSPPTVIIDSCGGGIWIRRGESHEVKAIVARNSNCKNESQAVAEDALRFIDVEMSQEAETIRITSRRTDKGAAKCWSLTSSIEIYIPDGARLDLKTDVGSIWVEGSPREVKARNTVGATGFQLGSADNLKSGELRPIKLEGWGGPVEIKLGPKGYEFSGSVKAVERFQFERNG